MDVLSNYCPVIVTRLCRIYRRQGHDGQKFSPFHLSLGQRLSSKKYGIAVSYWSNDEIGAFEESILHRNQGEYWIDRERLITKAELQTRSIIRLSLPAEQGLKIFPDSLIEDQRIPLSAIYGEGEEHENLVRDIYHCKHGLYDGIAYRSNQEGKHICYALFDRGLKKLENTNDFVFNSDNILANDFTTLVKVKKYYPGIDIENPSS